MCLVILRVQRLLLGQEVLQTFDVPRNDLTSKKDSSFFISPAQPSSLHSWMPGTGNLSHHPQQPHLFSVGTIFLLAPMLNHILSCHKSINKRLYILELQLISPFYPISMNLKSKTYLCAVHTSSLLLRLTLKT